MSYSHGRHIHILWKEDSSKGGNTPAEGAKDKSSQLAEKKEAGDIGVSTQKIFNTFLEKKTRKDAIEYLNNALENLKKENPSLTVNEAELKKKIDILKQWCSGNSLFDKDDKILVDIKPETLKSLKDSLGIITIISPNTNKTPTIIGISEKKEGTGLQYKNKSVETFKNEILQFCINHPLQTEYRHILPNELNEIKKLGTSINPEYRIIVETLLKVVGTTEYNKMTGALSKKRRDREGRSNEVKEFEDKLKNLVDASIKSGKPLDIAHIDVKKSLTQNEWKSIENYLSMVDTKVDNEKDFDKKLAIINAYIAATEDNPNKLPEALVSKIISFLVSKKHRIGDLKSVSENSITDIGKRVFGKKNTRTELTKAQEIAKEKEKNGVPHFVYFNKEESKYVVISIIEISDIIKNDITQINGGLFKSIIEYKGWYRLFEQHIDEKAFAAIGIYILKNPTTRLFIENPVVKDIFLNKYKDLYTRESQAITSKVPEYGKNNKNFGILFPTFNKKFGEKITEEMKNILILGGADAFYQKLVDEKMENGKIVRYVEAIEEDMKDFGGRINKEIKADSVQFENQTLDDYCKSKNNSAYLEPKTEKEKDLFNSIKGKKLANEAFSEEEIDFVLSRIKEDEKDPLYNYFLKQKAFLQSSNALGKTTQLRRIVEKQKPEEIATALSKEENKQLELAGGLKQSLDNQKLNTELAKQNSGRRDLEKYDNNLPLIEKDLKRLKAENDPKNKDLIDILESMRKRIGNTAVSAKLYSEAPGNTKSDVIGFIRDISDTKLSDNEISRWIDTQKYISTYIGEKNLVSETERRAAMMNLMDSKSIANLYGYPEKVDISMMTSDTGGLYLGDTAIGRTSLGGISDLMNCKIEVGDSSCLTRTIRSPEGDLIAANVPLGSLDSTIKQLSRFYTGGLGKLAPYMEQVSSAINAVRPDKITGLDGEYSINEDKEFLEIFATMLYGKENLPEERNIPNLLKLFNSPLHEKNPEFKLKQLGILRDDGGISTIKLNDELRDASKQII